MSLPTAKVNSGITLEMENKVKASNSGPPISQIVLKNFTKMSWIIKGCPEEILIKLAIVLKIPRSSWNTEVWNQTQSLPFKVPDLLYKFQMIWVKGI